MSRHHPLGAVTILLASAAASQQGQQGQEVQAFFTAALAGAQQLLVMLQCRDENSGCPSWAGMGECKNNPGFMLGTCRKSCGKCELGGEDAAHALEIALYAARNYHAGCRAVEKEGSPACAASGERLAAVLAVAQRNSRGTDLQRFLEAAGHEIEADARKDSEKDEWWTRFVPPAATAETRAATVGAGVPASTTGLTMKLSDGGQMPSVGLGTWLTVGQECYELVRASPDPHPDYSHNPDHNPDPNPITLTMTLTLALTLTLSR